MTNSSNKQNHSPSKASDNIIVKDKPGYKHTKLGLIPEDWEEATLGDTKSKDKWSITGGPFGSDLKVSDYIDEGGVRVLQLQNIGDGEFNHKSDVRTSDEKADQLLACNIYPGEIIISKMGDPVARACFIPDNEPRYVMASDGIRLKVNDKEWDSKFVLSLINSESVRNMALRWSIGSTRRRIGLSDLKNLPFVKPPLHEQQKIAAILSTWDDAIGQQQALIAAKQQYKKGLMQQLLNGEKRFPGFTEEWKEVRLGEFLTIGSGRDYKHLEEGPIPVYGTGGLMTYVNDYLYNGTSVGIGRKGTIDKPVLLNGKFWTVDTLFYTHSFNSCIPEYIFFLFLTINWKLYNEASGVPSLSKTTIEKIKVIIPPLPEQQKIASVLSAADAEIETLKTQLAALQAQKKGLMQKLLSGEVRVKVN